MSAVMQLSLLDPAEELAAAKADPSGRELSPAAQALYEAEGAARFAEHHPERRLDRARTTEYVEAELEAILARRRKANASGQNGEDAEQIRAALRATHGVALGDKEQQ